MKRRRPATTDDRPMALAILGLTPGEQVRFRRSSSGRWQEAYVTRRERDGSVGLVDRRGAARALPVELIEVRCTGPRGGASWEPLAARASRHEQLRLL
ncbi:MAG TPA: hypothetical protein VHT30_06025 [Acidimicrobiales bacterium]|jgi:hypothetical protein|nr:hypothetical protein [Acidimicrobiales bacterium]